MAQIYGHEYDSSADVTVLYRKLRVYYKLAETDFRCDKCGKSTIKLVFEPVYIEESGKSLPLDSYESRIAISSVKKRLPATNCISCLEFQMFGEYFS